MSQNLFLEVKKPEIKETKGTFIIQKLKSSYWGPFSGLKTQDLVKTSRIFSGVIFCRRSFWSLRAKRIKRFYSLNMIFYIKSNYFLLQESREPLRRSNYSSLLISNCALSTSLQIWNHAMTKLHFQFLCKSDSPPFDYFLFLLLQ